MITELPYQTFERIFHRHWPGGDSEIVRALLKFYEIEFPAGSAVANLTLQECLCESEVQCTNGHLYELP